MISAADAKKIAGIGLSKAIMDIDGKIRAAATMGLTEVTVSIVSPFDDPEIRMSVLDHLRGHGYSIVIARHPDPSNFIINWK